MCGFTSKERKKNAELREMLGLEPVSLVIKKGRSRWFGHVERKDDADWTKHCTTIEVKRTKPQDVRGKHGGMVARRI